MRPRSATLALGLLGAALLVCRTGPHGPLPPPAQIRVACPRTIATGTLLVAQEKGLWKGGHLQVTLLPFESGEEALDQMLRGGSEMAVVAETPIAKAILESGQLKVLASIHQSSQTIAMVARRDHGIRSPSDLRGKVIGFTKGSSAHSFLDGYLQMNRIGRPDVRFVELPPLQLRQALIEGRVDAVSTGEPHLTFLCEAIGSQAQVFRDDLLHTQTSCLVARPEFVQNHPGLVKRMLQGLVSAAAFIATSPLEASRLVGTNLPAPPSMMAKAFQPSDFDIRLDQALVLSLESECRWFQAGGAPLPGGAPDALSHLYHQGLLEVRPQAVHVIRNNEGGRP